MIVLPRSRGGTGHVLRPDQAVAARGRAGARSGAGGRQRDARPSARAPPSRGTCPSPPASCVGLCKLMWMVEYNPYSRASTYLLQETVVSGFVPPRRRPPTTGWWACRRSTARRGRRGDADAVARPLAPVTNYTCNWLEHLSVGAARRERHRLRPRRPLGRHRLGGRACEEARRWLAGAGAAATAAAALARSRRRRS